jgi:hypothetical protein
MVFRKSLPWRDEGCKPLRVCRQGDGFRALASPAIQCKDCGPGWIGNLWLGIEGQPIPRVRCKGCGCTIELWNLWTQCNHLHPDETGKRRRCRTVNHLHLPLVPLAYHYGLAGV